MSILLHISHDDPDLVVGGHDPDLVVGGDGPGLGGDDNIFRQKQ